MKVKALVVAVLMCCSTLVMADKVRVLGVQEALLSSQAANDFRAQLEREFSSEETALTDLERQALAARDRVQQNQGLVSDEELQQLVMQFEKAYMEFQNRAEQMNQKRQEREEEFLTMMRPKLDQAIRSIIEAENIEVVIAKQATVFTSSTVDLTPRVIELLNQQ
ncbi:membrane protein [Nitrincola sp. A-D6]|uniref:OmpH family outer membrane protein n=1 Tax=Nitrincola sp. A-D6 TaxID=1545442 RepID=UPI00051FC543|nr:OmpH family outer membrane protein [Nitrincola sp. A-D6]KGK42512.1 membrane protein [Nitrincola sp. A-D6]